MELTETLRIIKALRDGCDPNSGEVLEPDNLYQDPRIIRALFTVANLLQRSVDIEHKRASRPTNSGKIWSAKEEEELSTCFDSGLSIHECSRQIRRTPGAVATRLLKLGKLTEEEMYAEFPYLRNMTANKAQAS